jgi:oxygen-independent coproporphyrinogen-3 oxidase
MPLQAVSRPRRPRVDALYFHVPFCFHKCHYCDFYSIVDAEEEGKPEAGKGRSEATGDGAMARGDRHASPTSPPARQDVFLRRLLAELELRAGQADLRPRTIFVGGGTPTLLEPDAWRQWLDAMRRMGLLQDVTEFTVEANPETVSPQLMRALAAGGVNRISLGAQSFHTDLLKTLERWHEPARVGDAARIVRDAGIANINLDLIFAIPGQTMAMLDADLDAALALEPAHLSYYSLIYEPNTAMTQRLKMGRVTPADEETERAMYARVMERLEGAGFEHYEVSNWARRDAAAAAGASPQRCEHNLIYWRSGNWLGLGPAAASHVDGHRWKNEPHLGRYLATAPEPPTTDHEHLPPEKSTGEHLMLLLRLREGAPLPWLSQRLAAGDPRWTAIDELIELKMLERTATHLRLTREGLFIADTVLAKLL